MELVQSGEIVVAAIHYIEGACFEENLVQNLDVVDFAMCNDDHSWDAAAQVEQGVQLHRPFVFAELGPRKKRQAKIDGGRVEGIDSFVERHPEVVVEVKLSGPSDQQLSKVGVDAPVAHRVGVRQSVARDATANAHVIELRLLSAQTGFDVAQTLAVS